MIAADVTTATQITLVAACFFLLLALLAIGRSMFRSDNPPMARRFRVGVFVERDHERESNGDSSSDA